MTKNGQKTFRLLAVARCKDGLNASGFIVYEHGEGRGDRRELWLDGTAWGWIESAAFRAVERTLGLPGFPTPTGRPLDFDEWAERLDAEDRDRLMRKLLHDPEFRDTLFSEGE